MIRVWKVKSINPIRGKDRIEILDILRGFALFGVIVVNMSVDTVWADRFVSKTPGFTDNIIAHLLIFLGAGKFLTLFSFLFGLGLFMQIQRSTASGVYYFPRLFRRLFVLLLFGLMHYLLIGWTDILHAYAVIGALLLFFHRSSAKTLLITAVSIMLLNIGHPKPFFIIASEKVISSLRIEYASDNPNIQANRQESKEANDENEKLEQTIRIFTSGSYKEILKENLRDFTDYIRNFAARWWLGSLFPLLLLGAYVARKGILENVEDHLLFLRRVLLWGLVIGLGCSTLTLLGDTFLRNQVLPFYIQQFKSLTDILGIRALGLSYASGLILLLRSIKWRQRLAPLAAIGRTAFTNYLLQTVIAVMLYYSVGFGLYGQVSPVFGAFFAIAFFAFQIIFSVWWLKKFRFGPAEWLWRSLTYCQFQRMRN